MLCLSFDYKPFFKTLIDKEITREQIKKDLQLSPTTMAKLAKAENVSMIVLDKLCQYLNCEIEDIIAHVKETE